MKKIFVFILSLLIGPNIIFAQDKINVTFDKCVDGDTAKVILNDEIITIRFLAIDTPETSHPTQGKEPFGAQAKEFTCEKLKNANKIQIEYDENSDKKDKYDRHLVWVWTDEYLLQDELIKEGLAEVAYLYGDYKYTGTLEDHQSIAKAKGINVWSKNNSKNSNYNYFAIIIIIIVLIGLLISGKLTKGKAKKIFKALKKYGKS